MNPLSHYTQEALSADREVIAELMDALQDITDIDDGDIPGLWCWQATFDHARDLLTRYAHLRRKA